MGAQEVLDLMKTMLPKGKGYAEAAMVLESYVVNQTMYVKGLDGVLKDLLKLSQDPQFDHQEWATKQGWKKILDTVNREKFIHTINVFHQALVSRVEKDGKKAQEVIDLMTSLLPK